MRGRRRRNGVSSMPPIHRKPERRRRRGRGQSLVEFALVLPVLLLILLVALDFGRAFFAWVGITNATRAGAAYAASNPDAGWGTAPNPSIAAAYRSQITTDLLPTNCTLPSPIPLPSLSGTSLGSSVTVTLTCTYNTITPLVSAIVGSNVPISATTVYPVRAGQIAGGPVLNQVPVPAATPEVTPDPSASVVPPDLCEAPRLTGLTVAEARAAWQAEFSGAFAVTTSGWQERWIVTSQIPAYPSSLPGIACDSSASVTASANGK